MLLLDVRDAVFLAVILPEDETPEYAVRGKQGKLLVELFVIAEMGKVFLHAFGGNAGGEGFDFPCVHGKPCGLTSDKTGIRYKIPALLIAVDRVLGGEAREDAESVDGDMGMLRVKLAQEGKKPSDIFGGDFFFAGGKEPSEEHLVNGENDGMGAADLLPEPVLQTLGIARLGIVVLQFRGRDNDIIVRNLACVDHELTAGGTPVQRDEKDAGGRERGGVCGDGTGGRVGGVQDAVVPKGQKAEKDYEKEDVFFHSFAR